MAQSNWTVLSGSLSSPQIEHGVTAGVAKPNGGGNNVYGVNSLEIVDGCIGLIPNLANFAPMAKGGTIQAAVKRGVSGGPTGFAPMLFIGLGTASVSGACYILGLSDGNPYHIELRKGLLSGGLPDAGVNPASGSHILMRSIAAFDPDQWHHLRLDMILEGTGDVLLQCFQSDLGSHLVTAPVWVTIPGMEGPQAPAINGFIDDALAINTGSAPLTSGRAGIAVRLEDVTRRAFFDHVEVHRQL